MLPTSLLSSFCLELQKEASISDVAEYVIKNPWTVPATGAALSGGLAAYDLIRARKHAGHYNAIRRAMYDDEGHVDAKEYLEAIDPTVKVVSSIADAQSFAQDEILARPESQAAIAHLDDLAKNDVKREVIKSFVSSFVIPGTNVGAVRGLKGDYILTPPKAPPAILEHELGHIRDFREKNIRMLPEDEKANPYIQRPLLQRLWKPSYMRGQYKAETEAWDRADSATKDYANLRERALGTYETNFHRRRGALAAALAAGLGSAAVLNKVGGWRAPLATGAIGAALTGGTAVRALAREHSDDRRLHDLGRMSDEVWKKRTARRRNLVLGAAATGGAAGAAAPHLARVGWRKGVDALGEAGHAAGRRFAEGATAAAKENADEIWKVVEHGTPQMKEVARGLGREGARGAAEYAHEVREPLYQAAEDLVDRAVGKGIHRMKAETPSAPKVPKLLSRFLREE